MAIATKAAPYGHDDQKVKQKANAIDRLKNHVGKKTTKKSEKRVTKSPHRKMTKTTTNKSPSQSINDSTAHP